MALHLFSPGQVMYAFRSIAAINVFSGGNPGEPPIAHFFKLVRLDMTVTNQNRVLQKIQLIQESFVFEGIVRFVFGGRQTIN